VPAKTGILKSASTAVQGMRESLTYLEQQRAEDAAAVAAGDPDDDRVTPWVAVRLDEVVEQLCAVLLVHGHVPGMDKELVNECTCSAGVSKNVRA
jgi:hypothetical protein